MPYERYFMLNAAVPIEAYDASTNAVNDIDKDRMLPRDWIGYDDALKASHWHELFDAGDGRRKLTWKGRFSGVNNVVNYHSSEEEVLRCGNGETHFPLQREWAWYNQERIKGVKPVEQFVGIDFGRNEGGWEFNSAYFVEDTYYDYDHGEDVTYFRKRSAAEANALLSSGTADFKSTPFFGWFEDRTICTNAFLVENAISPQLRAQLLADAIPAESLPAGLAPVPKWNGTGSFNFDMAFLYKDRLAIFDDEDDGSWGHSFFLSAPYMVVHKVFENIIKQIQ